MRHGYEEPLNERFRSIRMSAAQRREAIAQMQRAEAIADLILGAARLLRRAGVVARRVL